MECPNCGNEVYERLDYAIVQCTQCMSLWDPYVYPGFPKINVEIGEPGL
jgi:ribosomal protein L37AE/L43A